MLSTSVWNLPSPWTGVERASIYMMMFLALAMLFLPLVRTQEAEAVPAFIPIGTFVISIIVLGVTVYRLFCKACRAAVGMSTHYTICYGHHYGNGARGYYVCQKDQTWLHGACDQN